jgi:GntR family transcriptional repressor for pyruvate dehydrogenase complex
VSDASFARLPRRTVTMDAVNLIKEMILEGRLRPGQQLPAERALCEVLGVSRPSVREAIRSLVAMHILEVRHGSGTFVTSLRMEELLRPLQFAIALSGSGLRDLYDVRLLLEPGAAALAAERGSDEELEAILRCAVESGEAGHSDETVAALDGEFHARVVRASHNGLLINLHESISALVVESASMTARVPGVPQQAGAHHIRIAQALRRRRSADAERIMREHFQEIRDIAIASFGDRQPGPASAGVRADAPVARSSARSA